jgi:hypothetical protein
MTREELAKYLRYDPGTGLFTRLVTRGGKIAGSIAGFVRRKDGYVQIADALAHRLAWLYVHGEWPQHEIDHINGIRADNRWANLREASRTLNNQNRHRAHRNNALGVMGVRLDGKTFIARIRVNKKLIRLGRFNTQAAASAAYMAARRSMHGGNTL